MVTLCPIMFLGNSLLRLFLVLVIQVICLAVYIYPGTVLPLGPLYNDPNCGHLVYSYAAMGVPHNYDGNPTPYISIFLVVGFPTLG